jgi:DNA-binding GntR family transcriptional regulator
MQSKKHNLAKSAYRQIKEAIIYARFRPRDALSENMLAGALGMSRTPVREALKELANEGLVEILPGRGAFVRPISLKDLCEIYELRQILESEAIKTAVHNISDAEILKQEKVWLSHLNGIKRGEEISWESISLHDNQLHNLIIHNCDNNRLKAVMEVLNDHNLRYQLVAAKALGFPEETIRQHLEIINLIKNREIKKLPDVLQSHIELAKEIIMRKGLFLLE